MEFLVLIVFGAITAALANSRGRNAAGWFFIGFFFGCFGLILVLVLGDLKKEGAANSRLRDENRRLRETVRKDRMVADSRHEATTRRLGIHDRSLGLETGKLDELSEGEIPVAEEGATMESSDWFYSSDGNREGPVSFETLRLTWLSESINEETLVWCKGEPDWVPIREIPGLATALDA